MRVIDDDEAEQVTAAVAKVDDKTPKEDKSKQEESKSESKKPEAE